MREVLFLLLVLACPLAMFFMMRGGHGHGGHDHGGHGRHGHSPSTGEEQAFSADELRRRRRELDRLIEERERAELSAATEPAERRERSAGVSSAR